MKHCIHCRKKLGRGETTVCLSCSLDHAAEDAEREAETAGGRDRRQLLFDVLLVLFVVLGGSALFLWKEKRTSEPPVQRAHPLSPSMQQPRASHEIQIPHGTNTMLVHDEESIVSEPSVRGESMIEDPDDVANDILSRVFSDVIRDRKRDFFGPFQSFGVEEAPSHFVFLRYRRLGEDNDGLFTVQAGEAVEENKGAVIFWEPPHLSQGFPWCYLLSWKPGEELLYRCLGNRKEVNKDTSLREWKYEYHFTIQSEDTNEYVFSRSCRPNEMEGTCSAYTEEVRDLFADACADPLRNVYSAEDFSDPVWKKFYRTIIRDAKREQLMEACRSSIDGTPRIAFLTSYPRKDAVPMVRAGEYDVNEGRMVRVKNHEYHDPFCEITDWIPGVLLRYECSNPAMAITPDRIPVTEYQWDMNLDYATSRICRGVSPEVLLAEGRNKKCTPRQPI